MNLKSYGGFARYGVGILALVLVLVVAFAGQPGAVAQVEQDWPSISGNIGDRAIEIDDWDDDPNTTPDANMEPGTPAECPGSPDPDCPFITGADYIDWNDLVDELDGKFVIFDQTDPDNSFAGTSTRSCLQPDHAAPQKEDILRIYLADNGEYLYFGLADLSPSGDSRHLILFHKNPVQLGERCAGNGQQMRLLLTEDDKLIRATFKPSADEPTAQVYSIVPDASLSLMYMDQAANYFNTDLWEPSGEAVNFAVNLADLTDDLGGGVTVPAETFGEGAVALSALGVPPCGASYQVSIITRSSGSGGGEAKDYVGGIYTFPSIYVAADLIPRCDDAFDYSAQAYYDVALTKPINAGVEYEWICDPDVGPPTGKSGTLSGVADGAYECTVTATLSDAPACYASDSDTVAVSVLEATATLDDSCTLTFPFSSGYTGALGTVSYAWSFSGPTTVTPASSTDASGTASVAAPGGEDFTGNLTVTDLRTDNSKNSIGTYECYASASDTADVYGPISVYIAPDNTSLMCPLVDTAGTDVTYTAYASGGDGNYTYTWNVTGDNTAAACGGSTSCLVDSAPADYCAVIEVQVNVDDGFGLCAAKNSETETVTKETTVAATDG